MPDTAFRQITITDADRKLVTQIVDQNHSLFLKYDQETWRRWVDLKSYANERTWHDLKIIIEGNYRRTIKARAIFQLLVPELAMSPIYWKSFALSEGHPLCLATFGAFEIDYEKLDPELQRLAAYLVYTFGQHVKKNRSRLDPHDLKLRAYQKTAAKILTLKTAHENELARFLPISLENNDDECLMRAFFIDPGICEAVKCEVDHLIRQEIKTEVQLKFYVGALGLNWGRVIFSQTAYLAGQIEFVLTLVKGKNIFLFLPARALTILKLLDSKTFSLTRQKFLKYMIFENGGNFPPKNFEQDFVTLTQVTLDEVGDLEPPALSDLKEYIYNAQGNWGKMLSEVAKFRGLEKEVLSQMR